MEALGEQTKFLNTIRSADFQFWSSERKNAFFHETAQRLSLPIDKINEWAIRGWNKVTPVFQATPHPPTVGPLPMVTIITPTIPLGRSASALLGSSVAVRSASQLPSSNLINPEPIVISQPPLPTPLTLPTFQRPVQPTPPKSNLREEDIAKMPILDEEQWKQKANLVLNNSKLFDSQSPEDKTVVMKALLHMSGLDPQQWGEFNERVLAVWNDKLSPKRSKKKPILISNRQGSWIGFKETEYLFLTKDRMLSRAKDRVPLLLDDYRINAAMDEMLELDPLGFHYRAIESFLMLAEEDLEDLSIYMLSIKLADYRRILGEPGLECYTDLRNLNGETFNFLSIYTSIGKEEQIRLWRRIVVLANSAYRLGKGGYGFIRRRIDPNDVQPFMIRGLYLTDATIPNQILVDTTFQKLLRALYDLESPYPDSPVRADIATLWDDTGRINDEIVGGRLRVEDAVVLYDQFRRRFMNIVQLRETLGTRCSNEFDPADPTIRLYDIPAIYRIRFSNGICWEINSLIYWIREQSRGLNTSAGLRNYPSPLLWETKADYDRLMKHPLAIRDGLGTWIEERRNSEAFKHISDQTLEMIKRASQILVARGEWFKSQVIKFLDPAQMALFRRFGFDYYALRKAATTAQLSEFEVKLFGEINLTVAVTMKSDVLADFKAYYDQLSAEEKDALEFFLPGFHRNTMRCAVAEGREMAKLCVFVFADKTLVPAYNEIARRKGLPAFQLDTTE